MEDTKPTDHPICPYCGEIEEDLVILLTSNANKDDLYECKYCKHEYHLTLHIKYQYTTSKLGEIDAT